MSGLGIVLEVSERVQDLRNAPVDPSSHAMTGTQASSSQMPYALDESLLPPLPESDDNRIVLPKRPNLRIMSSGSSAAAPMRTPSSSSSVFPGNMTNTPFSDISDSEDAFIIPQSCEMDSRSLNIDALPVAFPSLESHAPSSSSLQNIPSLGAASAQPPSTSPLRRLKSLKNGIRKLSLSRMGSSTSVAASQTQEVSGAINRPLHSPNNSESFQNDNSSSSSGGESVKSTFSTYQSSSAHALNGHSNAISTTSSTPQASSHTHTSSMGSNNSIPKMRRRTISVSNSFTSATPPLPSPIVTLSENLASTKQNMASIEQNFFENWITNPGNNPADYPSQISSFSQKNVANDDDTFSGSMADAADKLAILNTPDDLVEYSIYLSEHKKSVELAYDVSKNRLVSSGWCSGHDIENLNLQRDSSLSQIDSKLLQIEAKLNTDFNISFLNNKNMQQIGARQKCDTKETLSPSLKDLESKCLYFSAEHGNVFQEEGLYGI
ncbi:hypothetical protein JCM33374_g4802 [Metschnikowia sp. JCM 33374]|nr:hypothetical protein JCM33374_g4802 [Metschnikowia sp. JCM 33374]